MLMEVDVEDMEADVLLRRCHLNPFLRLQKTYQDISQLHALHVNLLTTNPTTSFRNCTPFPLLLNRKLRGRHAGLLIDKPPLVR